MERFSTSQKQRIGRDYPVLSTAGCWLPSHPSKEELETAEEYFTKVIEGYADTNAFDNALNWLVVLNKSKGDLFAAAEWSASLAISVVSQRLRQKTSERDEVMQRLLQFKGNGAAAYVIRERSDG